MDFTPQELQLIDKAFEGLKEAAVRRCTTQDEFDLVVKAFEFANKAHYGVRRKSGEPYIIHPISVAKIVVNEIGLGCKSIVTALLHDVVEDTQYSVDDITHLFGEKIASLVDGLTKIKSALNIDSVNIQAENFKKILLTLNEDTRIILIKMADRLHNLRTIDAMPVHKKEKILSETMYIFIPLAHRLGLYRIKVEMENIWMKNKEPETYVDLTEKINQVAQKRYSGMNRFVTSIEDVLRNNGYKAIVITRLKTPYSVWQKMNVKKVEFEEIFDIYAVRIIFHAKEHIDERSQAWNIYSLITGIYHNSMVDRIRDWVTEPKLNGYEALHCTVMSEEGTWVEVQIRSERMDAVDERGLAAHWVYKGNDSKNVPNNNSSVENEMDRWLINVKDILNNPDANALDFLGKFHDSLLTSQITTYTPKGKPVILPKGSTALDFAYSIHTHIGNKAIAAKVNFKLQPLSIPLKNVDQVEIITAENQKPQREWLDFVKTPNAITHITEALKKDVTYSIAKGRDILENELKKLDVPLQSSVIQKLLIEFKLSEKDELYSKIASHLISLDQLESILRKNRKKKNVIYWTLQLLGARIKNSEEVIEQTKIPEEHESDTVSLEKLGKKRTYFLKENVDRSLSYQSAECCNPIPGDPVIGFIDDSGKVHIHKKSCPEAQRLASEKGDSILNVVWARHTIQSSLARIKMKGIDKMGILREITKRVSTDMSINISKIYLAAHDGVFEGYLDIYVHDIDSLTNLITRLKDINGVETISRADIKEDDKI